MMHLGQQSARTHSAHLQVSLRQGDFSSEPDEDTLGPLAGSQLSAPSLHLHLHGADIGEASAGGPCAWACGVRRFQPCKQTSSAAFEWGPTTRPPLLTVPMMTVAGALRRAPSLQHQHQRGARGASSQQSPRGSSTGACTYKGV